jgi:hypothetical protein
MYTTEVVFIHNNLLHVSAAHAAILREAIKRIYELYIYNVGRVA